MNNMTMFSGDPMRMLPFPTIFRTTTMGLTMLCAAAMHQICTSNLHTHAITFITVYYTQSVRMLARPFSRPMPSEQNQRGGTMCYMEGYARQNTPGKMACHLYHAER